jgi:hypothetical protein
MAGLSNTSFYSFAQVAMRQAAKARTQVSDIALPKAATNAKSAFSVRNIRDEFVPSAPRASVSFKRPSFQPPVAPAVVKDPHETATVSNPIVTQESETRGVIKAPEPPEIIKAPEGTKQVITTNSYYSGETLGWVMKSTYTYEQGRGWIDQHTVEYTPEGRVTLDKAIQGDGTEYRQFSHQKITIAMDGKIVTEDEGEHLLCTGRTEADKWEILRPILVIPYDETRAG